MSNRSGMMVGPSEHPVQGNMLTTGQPAPQFTLWDTGLKPRTLGDYAGKVKILSVIPSVDTSVCSAQTHRFNQEAVNLGDGIVVLTISADLPFALKRYCGNEGIENTETLSAHKDMAFADAYGVHDTEWRVCQRALFVIDRDDMIQYAEYVAVIGDEVNFDAAITTAKKLG
ncbi:MAG: thiol peroxidase [Anaerolineae bacterium]